jgi:hypothetical protein
VLQEFRHGSMRVSAKDHTFLLGAASLFKPSVLRGSRMIDAGKVLSQVSNCDPNIAVTKNRALGDFLNK